MLSMLRLRMPSSNNIETMFVQHYSEKGRSHRSGNVAASHKLAMMPQVVLQDDDLSRQDAANEIKFGLILLQEAA
jgi:hypothetical protein